MAERFNASRIALIAPKAKHGQGIRLFNIFLFNEIKLARYAYARFAQRIASPNNHLRWQVLIVSICGGSDRCPEFVKAAMHHA